MNKEIIGEFNGRTDGLPKIKVPKEQVSRYLTDIVRRIEQAKKVMSDFNLGPGLKRVAQENLASLEKTKNYYEQLQQVQQQSMNNNMSM